MAENNRFLGSITASSIRNLLHKSVTTGHKMNLNRRKSKLNSENVPPPDPNVLIGDPPSSLPTKSQTKPIISNKESTNPSVKVVVRIRPASGGDPPTVWKLSDDSICVGDRNFTFDSVLGLNSTQEDVFQLVGVPVVKNALAGYNTSVLAYGQTGGGKTYTMWGPPGAMVENPSAGDDPQGIVPRIFQMLFSEIQREQQSSEGKQTNFQCRCSFLEVYNDQIMDLLEPAERNLEIKDDVKNGIHVENLTEEYVTSYEDVTQILIRGLSSRKVGATSYNSRSSRSHVVFTCTIDSWCKESSSKGFGSSKTSRISFIDLAGFERNVVDDTGKQCTKEGKFVKKSTSQLGHLVNILVDRNAYEKHEAIPYRSSCLTHLLKESLGGNAKLSVICAVSSDYKCNNETVSTLRFGQQVKLLQNEPVINERTEDDDNGLNNQIRQLKEELVRAKSNGGDLAGNGQEYFRGQSVRESLNQLRLNLNNHLLILPRVDNDSEAQDVQINEDDAKELQIQIDNLRSAHKENLRETSEHYMNCSEEREDEEINSGGHHKKLLEQNYNIPLADKPAKVSNASITIDKPAKVSNASITIDPALETSIPILAHNHQSGALPDPSFSESPKIKNSHRKSITLSSNLVSNQNEVQEIYKSSELSHHSQKPSEHIRSSLRSSRIFSGQTESLAASLQKGLQIIDYHPRNSAANRSSASFSFEHLALKPSPSVDKENASARRLSLERQTWASLSAASLCVHCQKIIPVSGAGSTNAQADQEPKKDTSKEKELERLCKEQAAKVEQLNQMLREFKHGSEQKAIIVSNNAPNLDENKLLRLSSSDNHMMEFVEEKCEIHNVQEDMDNSNERRGFDINEKEALLREIEGLRSKLQLYADASKLQLYADASTKRSTDRLRSSLLSQSIQLRKSRAYAQGLSEDEFEKERQRWTEMESEWISLTDELRIDIESHRQQAEKVEMELRLEKTVTEELDDALQRSVLGHARMIEHYAELQQKYDDLVVKHRSIVEGIAEIKRAAAKVGDKGHGSRYAKAMAKELSASRAERERERELLKKENRTLKIQLRDTAEAVHAAGELLVRLREAEETAKVAEEKFTIMEEENEKLKKQMDKLKKKHKMEMTTMKQFLAESRLPEAALQQPLYREEDSDIVNDNMDSLPYDDQAWRAEFGAIYQQQF